MIETIETISTETVNRADEKTPEWVGMTVNGVLYYVNTEKKVWIKSADTIPYPRAYYPGIENECDYADLEPLWNYFGEEEEEESENEEEVFLGRSVSRTQNVSEDTAKKIDSEVKKIVEAGC